MEMLIFDTNSSEVPLHLVEKLRKQFLKYNVSGFTLPERSQRQNFVNQLEDFALDKSISSMTKNDGTPITMTDRAIIQVLLQRRTLSGNFTIPNFKGFIDNIENCWKRNNCVL